MAQEFLLPDPGEGIHEADILEIHVSPGDEVKDGDPLFSVETDKAVVDVPSSFDGAIEEVLVDVGDVVEVGAVLLTFTGTGEPSPSQDEPAEVEDEEPADEEDKPTEAEGEPAEEEDKPTEAEGEPAEEEVAADEVDSRSTADGRRPVPASPATRSLAKKLDVDLHQIEGSGPDGRIEPGDVQAAAERKEERPDEQEAVAAGPGEEEEEWAELRGVRKATGRHMAESWREIPHVTHHDVADITELEELRSEHAAEIEEEGGRLSITAFLVKAAATALADHPRFNARLDIENERLVIKREINIGVAVDTEDGLVVPVINDVPEKSIADIALELPEMAQRMRSRDRSMEELRGGTFTITNPGGIGGTSFNPIINHPEVAILGAARAREVPVISSGTEGDSLEIIRRLHLPLVLAFDHRVNDGADAARFMNTIKELLEDPGRLVLHL
jgi:pyruvate dehydrogenase E2 component (dihydrolipoamide acetyltransferase)